MNYWNIPFGRESFLYSDYCYKKKKKQKQYIFNKDGEEAKIIGGHMQPSCHNDCNPCVLHYRKLELVIDSNLYISLSPKSFLFLIYGHLFC